MTSTTNAPPAADRIDAALAAGHRRVSDIITATGMAAGTVRNGLTLGKRAGRYEHDATVNEWTLAPPASFSPLVVPGGSTSPLSPGATSPSQPAAAAALAQAEDALRALVAEEEGIGRRLAATAAVRDAAAFSDLSMRAAELPDLILAAELALPSARLAVAEEQLAALALERDGLRERRLADEHRRTELHAALAACAAGLAALGREEAALAGRQEALERERLRHREAAGVLAGESTVVPDDDPLTAGPFSFGLPPTVAASDLAAALAGEPEHPAPAAALRDLEAATTRLRTALGTARATAVRHRHAARFDPPLAERTRVAWARTPAALTAALADAQTNRLAWLRANELALEAANATVVTAVRALSQEVGLPLGHWGPENQTRRSALDSRSRELARLHTELRGGRAMIERLVERGAGGRPTGRGGVDAWAAEAATEHLARLAEA
jgi:hypothetical protein